MNSHLIIYIFVAEVVPAGSDIWEVQYFFRRVNIWNHVTEKKKSDSKVYPMYDGNRKLSARTWLPGMNVIGGDDRMYLGARW